MLATDLYKSIELPNASQLSTVMRPLVTEKVVSVEELGKNTWYSLTATGRIVANSRVVEEDLGDLDKVIPSIIVKLKEDWISVNQLVNDFRPKILDSSKYTLTNAILLTLKEAGICEEKDNKWKITANQISKQDSEIIKSAWNKLKEIQQIKCNDKTVDILLEISNMISKPRLEDDIKGLFIVTLSRIMASILHEAINKEKQNENKLDDACLKCHMRFTSHDKYGDNERNIIIDKELLGLEIKSNEVFVELNKDRITEVDPIVRTGITLD